LQQFSPKQSPTDLPVPVVFGGSTHNNLAALLRATKPIRIRMLVTPEMAKHWLETTNTRNRPISEMHWMKIWLDIVEGRWKYNGEPISFASNGTLLNGQHRLRACAESEAAIDTDVIFGLDPDVMNTIDIGKVRTAANIAHLEGVENASAACAAAHLILLHESGGIQQLGNKQVEPSKTKINERVCTDHRIAEIAGRTASRGRGLASPRVLIFCYYLFSAQNQELADRFFGQFDSGARLTQDTCWKPFNSDACPFASQGALDLVHFPEADPTRCDKGFDTPNGCRAHGMADYYGGIMAKPQGVRIKDNSTGVWGFGRSTLTSVSLVADSIYDQVLPEIYTDSPMPVNCKIASGRDESDFYAAIGIVGEGPLGAYGTGHKLDGQYHHGYPGSLGLMTSLGPDPNPVTFGMDTDAGPERAAGTAFLMIRRSDAKGLQLSRLSQHAMEAVVAQGLSGWVWTAPGVRVFGPPLTNPIWIAVNMLLRARGLRLGAGATTEQLDFAEMLFDVDAAIAAAAICDEQVTKLVGSGTETQFKFRGVLQEEKPLRDWLQEVLMNCLGYYTFANGKLKLGVRVNSSAIEAFTEGNILFRSLQLAPLKPSFNHLTANFADEDFEFVANSISLYDIDHATLISGGAGPLFLKSTVNLAGTASKSQAARIITVRLREELGGITPDQWKKARQISFRTTVLALNTEPGMVCSMTHPDMPGGQGEFRVTGWRLNRDYSIDIQGRATTDSMYDLVSGPKPADVVPEPPAAEVLIDTGVPGVLNGVPRLGDYGVFAIDDMTVEPDASGNSNIVGAHEITLALYYVDELATDLWASIDTAIDATTDPVTVICTVNPDTQRVFRVGDFVVFNDESADPVNPDRRSYECAQIIGPGASGDAVPSGAFHLQRAYPGVPGGQATFGTLRCAHLAGIRFYKLDQKTFTFSVRKGFFRTPGLPVRIEAKLPSTCIVAALAGVANHFGYGPSTVFPLSRHNEPYMPGLRTCNGGAYTFQVPGPLAVQENVVIPMKVQDAASIRCVYAYLQQGTTDGQSAFLVKISRDGGATWKPLEYMGIAQSLPDAYKTTYDFREQRGIRAAPHAPPAVRRLRPDPGAGGTRQSESADLADGFLRRQPARHCGRRLRLLRSRRRERGIRLRDQRRSPESDVRRHRDEGSRRRRAYPPHHLANAGAQRRRRPGVRYPGGRLAGCGSGSDRGDPDVECTVAGIATDLVRGPIYSAESTSMIGQPLRALPASHCSTRLASAARIEVKSAILRSIRSTL
jgi:hypothetical protein